MRTWMRWIGMAVVIIVAIAATTGASFELVSRKRAKALKIPGRLIEVGGGRRLQLDCRGTGSPTVVLESGLDLYGSLAWAAVHDSIARTTRVCAYSRAGIMWSDASPGAFDSRNAARDLHAALVNAGESQPLVMVGHSLGGPYVMTFTQMYQSEVKGVVFVDASHPDQIARMRDAAGKSVAPTSTVFRIGSALAWSGLTRLIASAPLPATWPSLVREVGPRFAPVSLPAGAREIDALPQSLMRAGEFRSLGDRPLVVLTAALPRSAEELRLNGITAEQGRRLDSLHLLLQADEVTWSKRARQEIISNASHYVQFDRPDVVIRAVRDVVGAVRQDSARIPSVVSRSDGGKPNI